MSRHWISLLSSSRSLSLSARYKFSDIRPFVSFEMGQFSRYLMVIAFLGRHIAFHSVQCVRPIYQPPPPLPPRRSSSASSFPRSKFLLRNRTSPGVTRACVRQLLPWFCAPFFGYSPSHETLFSSSDQWSCRCGENCSFQFIAWWPTFSHIQHFTFARRGEYDEKFDF